MATDNNKPDYSDMSWLTFREEFRTEDDCQKFLFQTRWPKEFVCPKCGGNKYWQISTRGLYKCSDCRHQVSLTAGTIFHKTRTPLLKWFMLILRMATSKTGVSINEMKRELEIRDYKTSSTEALRITFPNNVAPGGGAEWISFYANGIEFDTIEGDSSGGAVFTGRAAGTTSDLRNKRDIVPVTDTANSLEIVKGLEVIEFAYKSDTREVPERKIGFSAQQLLEVYPQPVSTFEEKNKENNLKPGDTGFKYHKVSEGALAPLLVSAIQEQQKLIEELRQEIDSLKK